MDKLLLMTVLPAPPDLLLAMPCSSQNEVCDIKVYNDDRHVISGSKDGTFVIWDVYQESRVSSHYCPTGGFTGLDLAADQVRKPPLTLRQPLHLERFAAVCPSQHRTQSTAPVALGV